MDDITSLNDSDLMDLCSSGRYEDGEETRAVRDELLDREFSADDMDDAYDVWLYRRLHRMTDGTMRAGNPYAQEREEAV
jgi:hypothetical protein